jgi:malonyl CoA-acyl carrier protein transacylase
MVITGIVAASYQIQALHIFGRTCDVVIAARPSFIARRRTTMPLSVLGLSVGIVLVVVCLLSAVLALHQHRVRGEMKQRQLREEHQLNVVNAAKEAHERTIAYACHQLRYVVSVSAVILMMTATKMR